MKFKIFYYALMALILAYCLYGYFTGTGLSGWLMQKQFEYFGQASDKMTVLIGFATLMIPLEIARYFTTRKNSNQPDENQFNSQLWVKNLALPKLLLLCAAMLLPALIGGGIFYYYYAKNQALLNTPIYDINLNSTPEIQLKDEHFVRFIGKIQEDFSYTVEEKRGYSTSGTSNETYTPLTRENWIETEPIRFIYYQSGYVPPNVSGRLRRTGSSAAVRLEGRIIDAQLPVYVRSEYEKAGLKIAETYYIVQSDFFFEGKPRDDFRNNSAWFFLVAGIIASVLGLFVILIHKIQKPVEVEDSANAQTAPLENRVFEKPTKDDLVDVWRKIIVGDEKSWALFENGTAVVLTSPETDLSSQAINLMKQFGEVHAGSSAGDFSIINLEDDGWVVTSHHPDIITYVSAGEVSAEASELFIGLIGRSKRDADADELKIIHVEDKRN